MMFHSKPNILRLPHFLETSRFGTKTHACLQLWRPSEGWITSFPWEKNVGKDIETCVKHLQVPSNAGLEGLSQKMGAFLACLKVVDVPYATRMAINVMMMMMMNNREVHVGEGQGGC